MPRVPYLRDEDVGLDDIVTAIRQRRGGTLLNLDRQLLYSPPLAQGWNMLLGAVRTRASLSPRLRELAICAVATLNDAPYEFLHHAPELVKAGGSELQVEALTDMTTALERTDLFDRQELAVLRLTAEMTQRVAVRDATFSELRIALGEDRHAVELVVAIAAYNMVSRVIVALGIEPEHERAPAPVAPPARVHLAGRVNVPGAAISYRMEGPEGAPMVMLAHCLGADLSLWSGVLEPLTRHYRVLRYDQRGHGSSSTPPAAYQMAALADDAIALLDALGLARVHFVGVGLGGTVGLQVAARYPNRISGLVLCSSANLRDAWKERIGNVRAEGLDAVADATMQRWLSEDFRRRRPDLEQRLRAMLLATRPEGWLGCAVPLRDLEEEALARQSRAPTLLIAGGLDAAEVRESVRTLGRRIQGARVQEVPDAAHLVHLEQPEIFVRLVRDFLAPLDAQERA